MCSLSSLNNSRNISNGFKHLLNNIFFNQFVSHSSKGGSEKHLPRCTYNIPHPSKDPPENYQPTCVEHEAFEASDFLSPAIFRPFKCPQEILGPGAHKDGCYKNPEYFAYHRYSFAALQRCALKIRQDRIQSGGMCCIYDCKMDCEESDYEDSDCEESDNDGDETEDTCEKK